uniref:Uncharacterized protein n=1 Tax=Timema shepardi TaxID=629360 RepID=A0A7R9FYZ7_TIMSH|nr:unnamed protein product [Timema shepardi]
MPSLEYTRWRLALSRALVLLTVFTLEVCPRRFRQDFPNSEHRLVAGAIFFLRHGEMRHLYLKFPPWHHHSKEGPKDWQYKTEPQCGFCEAMKDSRCFRPSGRFLE